MNDLNPLPGYKSATSLVTDKQIQWEQFIVIAHNIIKTFGYKNHLVTINLTSICC